MKTYEQRINNIIGQLNGINKMIGRNDDCLKVLIQLKAIKSSVSSLMDKFVEDEFENCLKCARSKERTALKEMFSAVIKK